MDLNSPVGLLPMVGPIYQKRLEKIGIKTFKDLIYHIPNRYLDFRQKSPISRLSVGDTTTIKGKVDSIKNLYTRSGKKIQLAQVSDKSGNIDVIWFNQPFLIKTIKEGETYSFSGKVDWFGRKKAMISPFQVWRPAGNAAPQSQQNNISKNTKMAPAKLSFTTAVLKS